MTPTVDLAPTAQLLLLAAIVAAVPLAYVWLRHRGGDARARLAALTALTLFLTFDLIVFGSFTRLSDSGLGCPDWPGCYGSASPFGARDEIHAAQTAQPTGPVTWSKAWIEMIHRYLAMTVGALILVMAVVSWIERRRLPHSPWWATLTLVWVVLQGLFGKFTVTLKLYPAIVTLHLVGGLLLLALLAIQHEAYRDRPLKLPRRTRQLAGWALAALAVQIVLGGWVSTNYAVLACTGWPACNGQWWPAMDWAQGFTVLRELGQSGSGATLSFDALVAIHFAHRWFVLVPLALLLMLAWQLRVSDARESRRYAFGLVVLLVLQIVSGLSNVVLGWPLIAALGHSAGAAGLVLLMALLLARSAGAARPAT